MLNYLCFNRTLLSCVQMKRSSRSAWWRLEQTLGTSISLHVQRGGEAESLLPVSGLPARPASCVDSSSVCSSVSSRTNDLCCSSAISCDQLLSATNDHRVWNVCGLLSITWTTVDSCHDDRLATPESLRRTIIRSMQSAGVQPRAHWWISPSHSHLWMSHRGA